MAKYLPIKNLDYWDYTLKVQHVVFPAYIIKYITPDTNHD